MIGDGEGFGNGLGSSARETAVSRFDKCPFCGIGRVLQQIAAHRYNVLADTYMYVGTAALVPYMAHLLGATFRQQGIYVSATN